MRMKKHLWQIQEAKQRFSEVVRFANSYGPQQITCRGEPCVWILSDKDFHQMTQSRENIVDFLQRSPHREIDLKVWDLVNKNHR